MSEWGYMSLHRSGTWYDCKKLTYGIEIVCTGQEFNHSFLGLNGSNAWEAAEIHMIWDCIVDSFNAGAKAAFCKDPEEQVSIGSSCAVPI